MPQSPAATPSGDRGEDGPSRETLALIGEAEARLQAGQPTEAAEAAQQACELAPELDTGWRVLGRSLEAQGDLHFARAAYEQALARAATSAEDRAHLGRVALRLGAYAMAQEQFTILLEVAPPTVEAIVGLAQAQIGLMAYDKALATLRTALQTDPGQPLLWLTLGQLLCAEGRHAESGVFFEEALRLEPGSAAALAALADAVLIGAGDFDRALALSADAVAAAGLEEVAAITAGHARRLLAAGRLAHGWTVLASGLEPGPAAVAQIKAAALRWAPGAALQGRLLLIGEESVVDEILLLHAVPGLLAGGVRPVLAIDPRWGTLAERAFPGAMVVHRVNRTADGKRLSAAVLDSPQIHSGELVAAWAPLRSLVSTAPGRSADFPISPGCLKADPRKVSLWRERLAALGPGPKVGFSWSAPAGMAAWEFPPPAALKGPLSAPGLRLISLPPERGMGDIGWLRTVVGLEIHDLLPNLEDFDDLAALTTALDVVVGPPDAATCLAASVGARTWFLIRPQYWVMLGGGTIPWFPEARVLQTAQPNSWSDAMQELGEMLSTLAERSGTA